MKRCPTCRRDYYDDSLLYCLDDGSPLLEGPASGGGAEPATQRLEIPATPSAPISESPTRALIEVPWMGRRMALRVALALLGAAAIGAVGYGVYRSVHVEVPATAPRQTNLQVQAMTQSGNIREAAISPDGRFLAYTEQVGGKAAVWTKQISTGSKVQITPATEFDYLSVKFSPDGEFVYYVLTDAFRSSVYKVPTLGGAPVKVLVDLDGDPSFSPDGKQMAFERYTLDTGESALYVANIDGTAERKLISRDGQRYIMGPSVAWSPNGRIIAFADADDSVGHNQTLSVIDVATGAVTPFAKRPFAIIRDTVWLSDGTGLIFVGSDKGANVSAGLWQISYPEGEPQPLTRDLAGYTQLSITADGKSLLTVQRDHFSSIYFSNDSDVNHAEQISRGKQEGIAGISLTSDGRIVYVSSISGTTELWIMNQDGSGARQITNDGISKYTPAVSPDLRYIFFVAEKNGSHLWRVNLDGTQPTQLTFESEDGNPRVSPDGRWIVFDSFRSGTQQLWKMPVDGGEPVTVAKQWTLEPDISPDGRYIACFSATSDSDKKIRLSVLDLESGQSVKSFDVPQTVAVDNSPAWTPDGKGITYIDWLGDVSNLWLQPLDGGPPKQLTNYKQGYIYRRQWTRDGKKVAIVRGTETSDAVMITGF